MHKFLLLFFCLSLLTPSLAAPISPTQPPSDTAPKLEQIKAGELRLYGKIVAVLGTGMWQIEAISWTSPRGITTYFDEKKDKIVQLIPSAHIHFPGSTTKIDLKDIESPAYVAVIGKDNANGRMQVREVIVREYYNELEDASDVSIEINIESLQLLESSIVAYNEERFAKALQLSKEAVEAAVENSDLLGEAASLNQVGIVYSSLKQNKNALDTFKRVYSLGERLNDSMSQFLGLGGQAEALDEMGQTSQAISLLERATILNAPISKQTHIRVLRDLADLYIRTKKWGEAVTTWTQLFSLEDKDGQYDEATGTLLRIARYQARTDMVGAKKHLEAARERLKTIQYETNRSRLIARLANALRAMGDKQAADEQYELAARIAEASGDMADAEQIRSYISVKSQPIKPG